MFRGKMAFLGGAAIGAALAYFVDPQKGSARRGDMSGTVKQSIGSKVPDLASKVPTAAQAVSSMSGQVSSVIKETVWRGPPDNPDTDDATLRDRVETELFRDPSLPKGDLNINVANGVVELRGELPNQAQIEALVVKARAIPHVLDVHNYLHLPGTPAPNKESALRNS